MPVYDKRAARQVSYGTSRFRVFIHPIIAGGTPNPMMTKITAQLRGR